MRNLLLIILAIPTLMSSVAFAQMDPQYTMYMFNRQALNPAYVGSLEATNVTLLGRTQWVGIPGGPQTATASINGFLQGISSGIGATLIGDGLGTMRTFGAQFQYAYHLQFGQRSRLNIGVSGGLLQKSLIGTWIYNSDLGTDPLIGAPGTAYSQSGMVGDLGAGLYFHVKMPNLTSTAYPQDRFYVGLAASHLLEPKLDKAFGFNGVTRLHRGFNFSMGGTFQLGSTIYLQPSTFIRTDLASWQTDLTLNLYVSPMVFGINYRGNIYRNHDSFSGIVGFNANTSLFIGYSYDYTVSQLSRFTSGSHELIVSYTFPTLIRNIAPKLDTRGMPEK
jgi:type IX secretion system PorP/SprF family membrane protein